MAAVDGHVNFSLCRNYRREIGRKKYTSKVSKSNKPEVKI